MRLSATSLAAAMYGAPRRVPAVNLAPDSENLAGSSWAFAKASPVGDQVIVGQVHGQRFTEQAVTAQHQIQLITSISAGKPYCISAYVQQGIGSRRLRMQPGGLSQFGINVAHAVFDPSTGLFTSVGDNVVNHGADLVGAGVYRVFVSVVAIADVVAASVGAVLCLANESNLLNYAGDGASGIWIGGVQYEVGTAPKTYVKTGA